MAPKTISCCITAIVSVSWCWCSPPCTDTVAPSWNNAIPASFHLCLCISVNCVICVWIRGDVSCRMSGDELNPAAVAQPVEDVQGDGRWMSQVGGNAFYHHCASLDSLLSCIIWINQIFPYECIRMTLYKLQILHYFSVFSCFSWRKLAYVSVLNTCK